MESVKIALQEEFVAQDLREEHVEVVAELCALSVILAIHELLDFRTQAVKGASCPPSRAKVIDDHLESSSAHDCLGDSHSGLVRLE